MAEQIVQHLQAVKTFITQCGPAAGAKVLAAQREHLLLLLGESTLSVQDAANVVTHIRQIPFEEADVNKLISLVADKTCADALSSKIASRCKLQNFTSIMHFFTDEMWSTLMNENNASHHKVECILHHAVRLQLRNPSESTLQALTGIYLARTNGVAGAVALCPSLKYHTMQHIKKSFKNMTKSTPSHVVLVLPSSTKDFTAKFGSLCDDVFGSSKIAACPLDLVQLEACVRSIPMRCSSKMMTGAGSASSSCDAFPSNAQPMQVMSQLVRFMQMQQMPRGHAPIDIQFLQPPLGRSPRAVDGVGTQSPRANPTALSIEPGAVGPASPAGTNEFVAEEPLEISYSLGPLDVSPETKKKKPAVEKPKPATVDDTMALIAQKLDKKAGSASGSGPAAPAGLKEKATGGKAKAKGKAQGKAKAKAKGKAKAKAKAKPEPAKKKKTLKLPCMGVEWSRNQVQCRGIDGRCHSIKFDSAGGSDKAIKLGKSWLKKELAKQEK